MGDERGEGRTARAAMTTAATDALDVARQVAAIVRRVTAEPRCRVVLFGSWATGWAHERSDIDIGLLGPAEIPAAAMAEIREACEAPPTLYISTLSTSRRPGRTCGVRRRRTGSRWRQTDGARPFPARAPGSRRGAEMRSR